MVKNIVINSQKIFISHHCIDGEPIAITELLESKDNRQAIQQKYIDIYKMPMIFLTLVSPGSIKKSILLDYVFNRALEDIKNLLKKYNIAILYFGRNSQKTGNEAFWIVKQDDASQLKKYFIILENSNNLARLWDIDIIDKNNNILSRTDFQGKPRSCLICDDIAKVCAYHKKHSINELYYDIQTRVLDDVFIQTVSNLAYNALITEVNLTPKPGLVDKNNTGSHNDMNIQTFYSSADAIASYFQKFIISGMEFASDTFSKTFNKLRLLGVEAEQEMFRASNNVNTHKGAIFSFALICGAIGRLYKLQQNICIDSICNIVSKLSKDITLELKSQELSNQNSVFLFKKYNLTGARGEAESGFSTIRKFGIPIYKQYSHYDKEHLLLIILLNYMSCNQDTNLVNRGGIDGLKWIQDYATRINTKKIIKDKENLISELIIFDRECIKKNLSPGGSADLVAITCFLLDLEELCFRYKKDIFIN